jgi:hypothetical protein
VYVWTEFRKGKGNSRLSANTEKGIQLKVYSKSVSNTKEFMKALKFKEMSYIYFLKNSVK